MQLFISSLNFSPYFSCNAGGRLYVFSRVPVKLGDELSILLSSLRDENRNAFAIYQDGRKDVIYDFYIRSKRGDRHLCFGLHGLRGYFGDFLLESFMKEQNDDT